MHAGNRGRGALRCDYRQAGVDSGVRGVVGVFLAGRRQAVGCERVGLKGIDSPTEDHVDLG